MNQQYKSAVDLPTPGQADLVREIAPGRYRHYYATVEAGRLAQEQPAASFSLVPQYTSAELRMIRQGYRLPQPERLLSRLPEVPPAPVGEEEEAAAMEQLRHRHPALDLPQWAPGPGWVPLLEVVCKMIAEELPPEALEGWQTSDMKEKFAGLRWYWSAPNATREQTAWLDDLLDQDLEEASMRVCQVCGTPGRIRRRGWHQTLCDEHAEGRGR